MQLAPAFGLLRPWRQLEPLAVNAILGSCTEHLIAKPSSCATELFRKSYTDSISPCRSVPAACWHTPSALSSLHTPLTQASGASLSGACLHPRRFPHYASQRGFFSWSNAPRFSLNLTNSMIAINIATFLLQSVNSSVTVNLMKSSWHIDRGEWWRLITPVFLHADIMHLLINTYSLYNLGNSLEPISGTPRFATIYFFATLAGNLASHWYSHGNSVGASTALFGLLGAEAVLYLRNRSVFANSTANLQNIALMIAINAAYGFTNPRIDNSGHWGGLVGGMVAAWLLGPAYVKGRWGRWEDRPPVNIFGTKK